VSENFETIPVGRIKKITKNNMILFEKNTRSSTSMNNLVSQSGKSIKLDL